MHLLLRTCAVLTFLLVPTTPAFAADVAPVAPPVAPVTPPAAQQASVTLRAGAGVIGSGGCGTATKPCQQKTLRARSLVVQLTPTDTVAGQAVSVERLYRAPATRAYRTRPSLAVQLAADGSDTFSLAAKTVLAGPGSWCYRLVAAPTATAAGATSAWRCIRYRPTISIGWVGDTAMGSRAYGLPPGDGRNMFANVLGELRAPDLMVGNYEGTLSSGGSPRCSGGPLCFIFQAPQRMASGLRHAGFDVMNLANNHGLDMGANARSQTIRALTSRRIAVTGLPGQITYKQVADTRVALVGFGFNPGMMDLDDMSTVRSIVKRASTRADVVVAIMHSGTEGSAAAHVPSGDEDGRGRTRLFVKTAIDSGADIVFGSGPHVVRGVEQRRGRLAFYSTGNFAGWRQFTRSGLGAQSGIVTVNVDYPGTIDHADWQGISLRGPGIPYLERGGAIVRRVRQLSRQDFGSRAPRITDRGRITVR